MALYKVTTKRKFVSGNFLVDKGMTVQVSSFSDNPLYYDEGNDINNAFKRVYGVDLKPHGLLSVAFLEVKKI